MLMPERLLNERCPPCLHDAAAASRRAQVGPTGIINLTRLKMIEQAYLLTPVQFALAPVCAGNMVFCAGVTRY
jgi:hypothetical protein